LSSVEIINANQWISTPVFAAALFRSECFGVGVIKKLRLSHSRKPPEITFV
jgi:hypothetical protein